MPYMAIIARNARLKNGLQPQFIRYANVDTDALSQSLTLSVNRAQVSWASEGAFTPRESEGESENFILMFTVTLYG